MKPYDSKNELIDKRYKKPDNSGKTRTAITVWTDDLQVFTALARLKFKTDPVNKAWREAMDCFIENNKDLFQDTLKLLEQRDSKK